MVDQAKQKQRLASLGSKYGVAESEKGKSGAMQ
jgi:hypothetical protein